MFVAAATPLDNYSFYPKSFAGLEAATAQELQARKADVAFLDGLIFSRERGESVFPTADDYLKLSRQSDCQPSASAGIFLESSAVPCIPADVHGLAVDAESLTDETTGVSYLSQNKRSTNVRDSKAVSEKQKVWRREKNREHAKQSRIRKKLYQESLQKKMALLKDQNDKLRQAIQAHLGDTGVLLAQLGKSEAITDHDASMEGAFDTKPALEKKSLKAAQSVQHHFVITDPTLPNNPVVYATQGFLSLTGYTLDQIRGRNCGFFQGPETDSKAVEKISDAFAQGNEMSAVVLQYRSDKTTFWTNVAVSPLRDEEGNISNFLVDFMLLKDSDCKASSSLEVVNLEAAGISRSASDLSIDNTSVIAKQKDIISFNAVDYKKFSGDSQAKFISLVG
jgi:PAS domain S-box-containing protein